MQNLNRDTLLPLLSLVCFTLALLAWTLASPVGSSPDEDYHQAMVYCASGDTNGCSADGVRYGHCYTMRPTTSGSCSQYKDLPAPISTQIKPDIPLTLYYNVTQFLVTDTLGQTTLSIRAMNAGLAMIAFFLALWLTTPVWRPHLFISLIICSVPSSLFFKAASTRAPGPL